MNVVDIELVRGDRATIEVGPVMREYPSLEISSSTAATPIEITTAAAHGLLVGDRCRVDAHQGNAQANGEWVVQSVPSTTRVTLLGSAGTTAGGATGRLVPIRNIDLSLANVKMWLTAKRSLADTDAAAVIAKTAGVGGGPGGITLNSPASTGKSFATVVVNPADTAALTETSRLECDVQLEEPDGTKTTVGRGRISVLADVTLA